MPGCSPQNRFQHRQTRGRKKQKKRGPRRVRQKKQIRPKRKKSGQKRKKQGYFSQDDVILITYGDSIKTSGQAPIATLHEFADSYLKGAVSTIHFLPFFPYSSDDGFSVVDYDEVDPQLGTWADIEDLGGDARLMFDAVVNHVSASSPWLLGGAPSVRSSARGRGIWTLSP